MKKQYFLIFTALFITLGLIVTIVIFSPQHAADTSESLGSSAENVEKLSDNPARSTAKIRQAAVAGDFYPKEPAILNKMLEEYFSEVEKVEKDGRLRILIVPHAGVEYSGQTSAKGFIQLKDEGFEKFIILGVSHSSPISHAAVYAEGLWETPFGNIEIDQALASRLISQDHDVIADDIPHQKEHSLELPILYLQKVADNYKIVPILLGRPSDELTKYLAYRIAGVMDDKTLLIISTDLSHYPNWQDANYADRNTINAILTGKAQALDSMVAFNTAENYPGLSTSACGYHALRVALNIAEIFNFNDIQELDYRNSGDITGDKGRVVGYAAIGMWSQEIPPIKLSPEAKEEALELARQTLENLHDNQPLSYSPVNADLNHPIGAFVTLNKNDKLRGCIGQFEPEDPLYEVLQSVTVSSATKDPRFTPVTKEELDEIEIEISTMSPQRLISDWRDIELGKQGVRILLNGRSGTLLPQVATDNDLDLVTFLETICGQKMGLQKTCYTDPTAQIYVYETDVFAEEDQ